MYIIQRETFPQKITPQSSSIGNTSPARSPSFKLSPSRPDTIPTKVGPTEQPISPPNASSANRAVPPFGIAADALLKVPGHRIPTDRPLTAQAIKLSWGTGRRAIPK